MVATSGNSPNCQNNNSCQLIILPFSHSYLGIMSSGQLIIILYVYFRFCTYKIMHYHYELKVGTAKCVILFKHAQSHKRCINKLGVADIKTACVGKTHSQLATCLNTCKQLAGYIIINCCVTLVTLMWLASQLYSHIQIRNDFYFNFVVVYKWFGSYVTINHTQIIKRIFYNLPCRISQLQVYTYSQLQLNLSYYSVI